MFDTELEKVANYTDFADFCNTFSLLRGKSIEEEESSVVGEFKVSGRSLYGDGHIKGFY